MNRWLIVSVYGLLLCARRCHGQTVSLSPGRGQLCTFKPSRIAGRERSSNGLGAMRSQAGLIPNPRFLFRKEDLRTQTSPFGENSQNVLGGRTAAGDLRQTGGRIAVAQQGTEESRLQADLVRRQIVLNVRESYWKAKAAQSLAALYAQDADYFLQVIEYHDARFREGKIAEVDLLRVRLQGSRFRAAAANVRLRLREGILMLAQEMNAAPNSSWVLSEDFETLEGPKPVPGGTDAVSLRTEGHLPNRPSPKRKRRPGLRRQTQA